MARMPSQPAAVDLFSGAGGLSLGVSQAGFKVVAAVELDPTAALTYAKNHRRTVVFNQDICDTTGKSLLATTPGGKLDLLMGCAPCQGFCQLTVNSSRQDPRNLLISQMSRLVRETVPRAVIMENVPGLLTRGKNLFADFVSTLRSAGYEVVWGNLQMADYGVPQMRRRLLLIASGESTRIGGRGRESGPETPDWRYARHDGLCVCYDVLLLRSRDHLGVLAGVGRVGGVGR